MKVKQLTMKNFRGFDDLTIDFEPNEPTIFVGVDGVGKSSILDCFSLLFFPVFITPFIGLLDALKRRKIIDDSRQKVLENIKNGQENIEVKIKIISDSLLIQWDIGSTTKHSSQLDQEFIGIRNAIGIKEKDNIPLTVYYPISRIFLNSIVDKESKYVHLFNQMKAYENALNNKKDDFTFLFNDVRSLEELEYENLVKNPNYKNPYLKGIRDAIYTFLNGFSNFQVQRVNSKNTPQMIIEKKGKTLTLNQLSEGEKCLLAMVGDLARRLAIANPGRDNPLEGEGIVLIDEIELHLHPQWQRSIIKNLTKTFPNCQFIVTTHSPQVISEVRQVHLLHETDDGKIVCDPIRTYGKDSNMIVETLMGTVRRSQDIQDDLDRLFELIGDEKIAEAKALKAKIEDKVGTRIPELARADWAITDLEIMQEEDKTDLQTKSP